MKMNRIVRSLLLAAFLLSILVSVSSPSAAEVAVGISVRVGPPALPVYAQPICPGPGYIWTPGYWAWNDDDGYYWVPGTWVVAPVGMLWTPGYWGWSSGFYVWHTGYWGPHVGFYGGINYGFGYTGVGFAGGEWRGRSFYYNRSVTNVNVTNVTNVYNKTVIVNNTTINRVSYNGGRGGVIARPTNRELEAEREPHHGFLAAQTEHERSASRNRELFASENHGRPGIAATGRAGEFNGRNVVMAKSAGAPYHAPALAPREARGPSSNVHRPGNSPNERENANNGFRKFGPPTSRDTANGRQGNAGNWNANRPNNSAEARQNANDNWHGSNPHQNGPRPVSQSNEASNRGRSARVENMSRSDNQPRSSEPMRQSAPQRPSGTQSHENWGHGGERHPNR